MTDAQTRLAQILLLLVEWHPRDDGDDEEEQDALFTLNDAATGSTGYLDGDVLTDAGAALVARYREHMAAERDAKAVRAINGVP